jgi:hypothetical protein
MLIADGRCRSEVSPQGSKGLILEDLGVESRIEANPVAVLITSESLMLLLENSRVCVCIGPLYYGRDFKRVWLKRYLASWCSTHAQLASSACEASMVVSSYSRDVYDVKN